VLRLRTTGTAGVLVRAKREGLIEDIMPLFDQMRSAGYFISDNVIAAVRAEVDQ
jgi:predicted nucleic acid-binding protein